MRVYISESLMENSVEEVIAAINHLSSVDRKKMDDRQKEEHMGKLLALYEKLREVQKARQLRAAGR